MSAAALRAWARFHRAVASNLETAAALKEDHEREAERRRRRRAELKRLHGQVARLCERGNDLDAALNLVALQAGIPLDQARAAYALGARGARRLAKARRNREIARLARQGLTNAEIGASLDPPLHPKTVQKILRQALPDLSAALPARHKPPAQSEAA